MDPRRTTVELPGGTVSLLQWTPVRPPGTTVLLLHGGGADNAELSWSEVGSALARAGHRVIAPDHPGFGQSPPAHGALTQGALVRYVGELVDSLDLVDYAVGGLSLGGGLTLGHLLDRPRAARGAMLLGSFGIMPRLTDGPFSAVSQFCTYLLVHTGLLAAMTHSYSRSPLAMERGLRTFVRNPAARTPELVRAVIEAASGDGLKVFGQWQRDQVRANGLRTDYTGLLPTIETPTLLVHGEHDSGVPLARARSAAELLPHAELLTVLGAGHWVQRDRPDLAIPAMLGFLEGLR
ncbi:alpha/beta fold hydrolase [Microbacterium sp. 18062]|uniref:alpha/beta fold hydrolase n=1 Tax=Microbacterium sp. 18062 TaxID=2681410 RepID=UPI001356D598|nr:alpha/beta hydrolase [Microbacterium sp. 18062]